jgi:hypothetical protein
MPGNYTIRTDISIDQFNQLGLNFVKNILTQLTIGSYNHLLLKIENLVYFCNTGH